MPYSCPGNRDLYQDYIGKIEALIEESSCNSILILGDWNAAPGTLEYTWMSELCSDRSLTIADVEALPNDSYSCVSEAHNTTSWLDHALVSSNSSEAITSIDILYEYIISDHRPMSIVINVGDLPRVTVKQPTNQSPTTIIRWNKLTENDLAKYKQRTELLLSALNLPIEALVCDGTCDSCCDHRVQIEKYYDDIVSCLSEAGKPFASVVPNGDNHNVVAGWNDIVKHHHDQARKYFLHWRFFGSPRSGPAFDEMKVTRARFKYALRACKAQAQQLEADSLANSLAGYDYRTFWRKITNKMRQNAPTAVTIESCSGDQHIADFWKKHYDNLLNSVVKEGHSADAENLLFRAPTDTFSLSRADINKSRVNLKLRKSVGQDGISSEHLRFAYDNIDCHFALCFNSMLRHGFVPKLFMPVTIIPIVKDPTGDISSSDNYRPIAIATSISKMLESSILDTLSQQLESCQNQFGFKKKHSTDQSIFLLKERICKYNNLGSPVFCAFLDASKAFDRVCHATLYLKLLERGVPASVIKLLKYWYENQTMIVSWNNVLSSTFRTSNGVRQGGILSPALFAVYVDTLSVELNKVHTGCYLNSELLNHIMYADDICLICPSISGLRDLIKICTVVGDHLSIKFNPKKSVCMYFSTKRFRNFIPPSVTLCRVKLNYVTEAKYLGHIMHSELVDDVDINRAKRALYTRGNLITRKFAYCTEEAKITLFRSFITPIYCAHLWVNYSLPAIQAIRVAYNNIFRRLFNVPRGLVSTTANIVARRLPTFQEIVRKSSSSLITRLKSSSNKFCSDAVVPSAHFQYIFRYDCYHL